MLALLGLALAADCDLTPGPEVAPGIPSLHAECHWPELTATQVDGVIGKLGHHDDVFWMIAEEEIVSRHDGATLLRQRHEVPALRAREAHVWVERTREGGASVTHWWKAEDQPELDDAMEPGHVEGTWRISTHESGGTRVVLDLAYDPAGWVPAFVVRTCQGGGARRALEQLRKEARTQPDLRLAAL